MAPLMRYLTRLCWLMRQGKPVADVDGLRARARTCSPGWGPRSAARSMPGGRRARLIGDDLIGVIRQGGWDYDLVDDDALAVLPTDRTGAR